MIEFCKFQGFGNDYLVFAAEDLKNVSSVPDFARRVCDRHFGVGADGIAVWEKSADEKADFDALIFNPDGSEAEFSGNGTRCAAAFLHYRKIWTEENLRLRTKSGLKNYRLTENRDGKTFWFEAELGNPKFDSDSIPMFFAESRSSVVDYPLEIEGESISLTAVNVGNPVACIFVEDFAAFDWRKIGAAVETRATFPERTNVVFVKILDREIIEVRIWERGAGETLASGTCAVAAAVASAFTEKTSRRVTVKSEGGKALVEWRESDDEMVLTGRADFVFCGQWLEPS